MGATIGGVATSRDQRAAGNDAIRRLTRGTDSAFFATLVYFVRYAISEAKTRRTLLRLASAKARAVAEAAALMAGCAIFSRNAPLTNVLKQRPRRQNLSLLDELKLLVVTKYDAPQLPARAVLAAGGGGKGKGKA